MTETKRVVFPVIWTHKSFIFYQNSEKFSLKFMKAGCSLHEILNFGPRKIIFDFRADYDFSGPTLKIQDRLSPCLNLQFHTKIQKKSTGVEDEASSQCTSVVSPFTTTPLCMFTVIINYPQDCIR